MLSHNMPLIFTLQCYVVMKYNYELSVAFLHIHLNEQINPALITLQYYSDPVSLAVAEAVLTTIEKEGLQNNAKEVGACLLQGFKEMMDKYQCIGDVR